MISDVKKVGIGQAVPLALQHVVAMVVGCVTVPTILGTVGEIGSDDLVIMMQASLLCAAIAILIHAYGRFGIGSNLPVIIGSGFAFIPTLTSIVKAEGISGVLGAQLVGALVGILVGFGFKKIRFLFPPIVTASVVLTVGISLYGTAVKYMSGGENSEFYGTPKAWIVALITLGSVLFFSQFCKGIMKVSSTLLGLIVGYILAFALGMVDFTRVANAAFIALPRPFHFGMSFSLGGIVSMIIIFVINSIQDIGQFEATTAGAFNRKATDKELSGGIIGNNISSALGAIFGGTPNATCGQNVGIVVTTNVTEKIVFTVAAVIIMVTALIPKLAGIFLTIPLPVLGGATITVFGSIAMTGVRMLSNAGLTQRNLSIAGLSVALAVGLSRTPGAFEMCPEVIKIIFGGSEIVIVALMAIILNLILPKDK
ncbi:MAG: purine/pyrimidine permease [Epulopiscium sp.]|nr:purine/pyrimidine permease [Candidatus Epulonipiscium sp.]